MTAVRKFRAPSRLARLIRQPGGKLVRDSIIDGQAALQGMRGACLDQIDLLLEQIMRSFGAGSGREREDPEALFSLASDLIDASAAVQDLHIEKAAHSLCRLCDVFREADRTEWKAVDVHIEVLKFLRAATAETPAAAREKMLRGLVRVVDRTAVAFGIAEAPPPKSTAMVW